MKLEDLKGIVHSDPNIMGGTPVFLDPIRKGLRMGSFRCRGFVSWLPQKSESPNGNPM